MKFKVSSRHHLTAIERKHLPIAYKYCQDNRLSECQVNQKVFSFDFTTKTGWIKTVAGSWKYDGRTPFYWKVS